MTTRKEKEHMDRVAALGCFVCKRPANLHHIRPKGTGIGRRSTHFEVVPLCWDHHQGNFSIHNRKKAFEKKHGTEKQMLKQVLDDLEIQWYFQRPDVFP